MTRTLISILVAASFSACAGGMDEDGNLLPDLAMDEEGRLVLDAEGNPIEETEVLMSELPTDEELEEMGAEKAYVNGEYKTEYVIREVYGSARTAACCVGDTYAVEEYGVWRLMGRRNYRPRDGARWESAPWWRFSGFGTCVNPAAQSNFLNRCGG